MTRSASIFCSRPSPPQAGQAPNGLLKENSRGSISEMVKPDTGQANFSENMMRLASEAAAVANLVSLPAAFNSPRVRGEVGSLFDPGEGASPRVRACEPAPSPRPSPRPRGEGEVGA